MVGGDPRVELGEGVGRVDSGVGEGKGAEVGGGYAGRLGGVLGVGAVGGGGRDDVGGLDLGDGRGCGGLDVVGAGGLHVGGGAEGGGVVVIGRHCGIVCLRLTALNSLLAQ